MEFERLFCAFSWAVVPTIGAYVLLCYDFACSSKVKNLGILTSCSYPCFLFGLSIITRSLHQDFLPRYLIGLSLMVYVAYFGLYALANLYLLFLLFRENKPPMVLMFALVVVVFVAAIFLYNRLAAKDCKLVMPGSYSIYCHTAGPYTAWYFWRWKSKNLDTARHPITVSITDQQKNSVPINTDIGNYEIVDADRSGERQFIFEARESGHFEVKCDDRCVLVIVPSTAEIHYSPWPVEFLGSQDDWNFLPIR